MLAKSERSRVYQVAQHTGHPQTVVGAGGWYISYRNIVLGSFLFGEGEVVSYAWCESERLDSHARRHWIFVSETLVAIGGFALRTQRQIGHQQTTHKIMSIESNRSAVWLLLSQVNSPVRGHQWLFAISHPYRGGRE